MTVTMPLSKAATLWTGSNTTWTKSAETPSDPVLSGIVELTRGDNEVLYNIAAGETFAGSSDSPLDTTWAFGTIDNYSTLSYQSLEWYRQNEAGFNMSHFITNKPMVMHIVSQDIYLSVKFLVWGHGQTPSAGAVTYVRSTAGGVPPTVSITSPADGATFDSPANVGLSANASGGTVTNVEYFAGATSLGSATVSPFNVAGNIPNPGSYALTAVATADGLSATSAVVNITVVARPVVSITSPTNGAVFTAPADVGIIASATVTGGGSVTNVSFFNNTSSLLGSSQTFPFSITASSLAAGSYALTAVATAAGISSTSSVVNITVVSPGGGSIVLTGPGVANGLFSLRYNAVPGSNYVVQASSNLLDWISLVTNPAASTTESYSESIIGNPARYYRVGRMP